MGVKPKRTFSWFLEHGMVYLLLIYIIFFFSVGGLYPFNTFGLNRTVGWLWDISNVRFYFPFFLLVYLLGSIVLVLLKRKTNKIIALFFLVSIAMSTIMNSFGYYEVEAILSLLSMIVFAVLFFKALFAKKIV
ncbi:hypothetical protein [Psychroserpens luteolus]|uniref:hypothetical protein n=1 Tax=Psychroserpens luteolus TaxID=2855840 RepID=UPI001E34F787|nr:hypothetical protein [Psychroserpens luteolus]MCD2260246.1 hypothetical protein [Psychroserpens luteolus]